MSSQEQKMRKRIMRACAADVAGDPKITFMEDVEERILAALNEACQAADSEVARLKRHLAIADTELDERATRMVEAAEVLRIGRDDVDNEHCNLARVAIDDALGFLTIAKEDG